MTPTLKGYLSATFFAVSDTLGKRQVLIQHGFGGTMNCFRTGTPLAALLAVAGLVVILPATQAQGQRRSTNSRGDTTIARLENDVPELMKKGAVPGLALAVIRAGKTPWVHGFGVKDTKTAQPVTEETVFEAASLSKPVFAYGVLKLVEQGKLGLDVPLTSYFSKPYIVGDERLEKITARIVLSHRTGFPNWRGDGNPLTIHFTPGERFSYSGEGFVYLQRAVEQITGKPLNEYMTDAVFTPLGMASSSYVWRPDFDERTATGHDPDGAPRPLWKPKEAGAASTLNTTAKDYALFVTAMLKGTGLKPATLREMEAAEVAVDPECTNCTEREPKQLSKTIFWGLGWGIQRTARGDALWHWGDNGVFKCFVMAEPKSRTGVVMFTNSESGLAIAEQVVSEAMGQEPLMFAWIKYDSYDSQTMRFSKAVRDKGVEAAITEFASALKSGVISEQSINSTGYRLLSKKQTADAIRIFRLNVELHAQSANVYDSLGEAYMEAGDKVLATWNYQKSLELDPKNHNAEDRLAKLKSDPPGHE
jgi:CubicO group peptidase (beta-lactamase class C family)